MLLWTSRLKQRSTRVRVTCMYCEQPLSVVQWLLNTSLPRFRNPSHKPLRCCIVTTRALRESVNPRCSHLGLSILFTRSELSQQCGALCKFTTHYSLCGSRPRAPLLCHVVFTERAQSTLCYRGCFHAVVCSALCEAAAELLESGNWCRRCCFFNHTDKVKGAGDTGLGSVTDMKHVIDKKEEVWGVHLLL